jgi:hypothetical protein
LTPNRDIGIMFLMTAREQPRLNMEQQMKNFIITVEYVGLTGAYRSRIEERAKNAESAAKKARKHFGNRDGFVISVVEATYGEA